MGYFLLWLENLGLSLTVVATLLACIARLRWRWVRLTLGTLATIVPLLVYLGLVCPAAAVEIGRGIKMGLLYPFVLLTICYCIGAIVLSRIGNRRTQEDPKVVAAARWPRGKLALALAAIFCVHVLTIMNMDAAVQQRMVAVQAEAAALAMSAAPEKVPDRDNAAFIYNEAFEAMGPVKQWRVEWEKLFEERDQEEDEVRLKRPEVVKFIEDQAGIVLLLREAATKPACSFDRDYGRPRLDMFIPGSGHSREVMALMSVDARLKAMAGDGRGAISDVQSMFHMTRHFSGEPSTMGFIVAVNVDRRACSTLESVLNSSPLSTNELEGIEIDSSFNFRRLLEQGLKIEEAFGLWTLSNVGGKYPIFSISDAVKPLGSRTPRVGIDTFYRVFILGDELDAYRWVMQMNQPYLTGSYQENMQELQANENALEKNRSGIFASIMGPANSPLFYQKAVATADARRRVAEVGLALHRCRAKHGTFPEKLADLTTEFLPVVPRDPFDGEPLRFKKTAEGGFVYSVGGDLIDQGGMSSKDVDTGDLVFEVRTKKSE